MVPATFFCGDPLLAWLVSEAARLWEVDGPSADLVGSLGHAAFATIAAAGDYRTGHAVVRRAMAESGRRYADWGAAGKVAELDREFPFVQHDQPGSGSTAGDGSRPQSTVVSSSEMDLVAILRAFQILSTETSPSRLQDRVAEVLGLLTGATEVRLVLWDSATHGWNLPQPADADSTVEPATVTLADAAAAGLVATSVFRYVERTRETLVVEDASADPPFSNDPHFSGMSRCAVMAVPIHARGAVRAVLLLENRLARGAFSARRMDVVQLIAGELGICLDNMLAERFRSLVQRSAELTLVCDRRGRISYASAACAELLGLAESQMIGQRLGELIEPEDVESVDELVAGVRADEPITVSTRVLHADGQPRWVDLTLTDLTEDPAVGGVMLRVRDVTEQHRLEIELRHAQKLESVGQLASGIAHEINTPMQFVTSNLHFLSGAFRELTDVIPQDAAQASTSVAELLDEIPSALAETMEGADRVVTIVRAMKAFGHPGGEGKDWVDLNEAIRNTLVVAANEIRPVADVVTELAALPPVWCSLGDVNQVVLNLVINAAHAMADKVAAGGGRGTLTVRTVAEDHGERISIEVRDTGTGIPDEIAGRVFDQFFTTKDVGVGTGQGLAVAHALVHDHHDGTITFTSTPGEGTTFTVRLPNRRV